MNDPNISRHSFIIRLWRETQDEELDDEDELWRGSVTHVPSGLSHHFQDISEVSPIIRSYLGITKRRITFRYFMHHLRALLKG